MLGWTNGKFQYQVISAYWTCSCVEFCKTNVVPMVASNTIGLCLLWLTSIYFGYVSRIIHDLTSKEMSNVLQHLTCVGFDWDLLSSCDVCWFNECRSHSLSLSKLTLPKYYRMSKSANIQLIVIIQQLLFFFFFLLFFILGGWRWWQERWQARGNTLCDIAGRAP